AGYAHDCSAATATLSAACLRRAGPSRGVAPGGTLTPNVSGTLGAANRAHAVVNAPWPQAGLGHVEAAALCPKTIGDRHAHLMVLYLSMPALATMGFSRLPRT